MIEALGMRPHREGGWYVETWRAPAAPGERAAGSAILFLLASGERSRWHRVDAAEVWQWSAGEPLALRVAAGDDVPVAVHRLGGEVRRGDEPQAVVPAGAWQAARPLGAWSPGRLHRDPGVHLRGLRACARGLGAGRRSAPLGDPPPRPVVVDQLQSLAAAAPGSRVSGSGNRHSIGPV